MVAVLAQGNYEESARGTLKDMRTAHIGMGGNIASAAGRPEVTLAAAASRLGTLGQIICRSSLYSTEPVGFAAQPRFVNAVVALETKLEPRELLAGLLKIEQEFGRDRAAGIVNGPRTLDLDILLFGDLKISELGLEIPHPRLGERAFVLIPLCEIDPLILEPRSGRTVAQLLHNLLPGSQGEVNGVVQIKNGGWRSDTGRCGAGPSHV